MTSLVGTLQINLLTSYLDAMLADPNYVTLSSTGPNDMDSFILYSLKIWTGSFLEYKSSASLLDLAQHGLLTSLGPVDKEGCKSIFEGLGSANGFEIANGSSSRWKKITIPGELEYWRITDEFQSLPKTCKVIV